MGSLDQAQIFIRAEKASFKSASAEERATAWEQAARAIATWLVIECGAERSELHAGRLLMDLAAGSRPAGDLSAFLPYCTVDALIGAVLAMEDRPVREYESVVLTHYPARTEVLKAPGFALFAPQLLGSVRFQAPDLVYPGDRPDGTPVFYRLVGWDSTRCALIGRLES